MDCLSAAIQLRTIILKCFGILAGLPEILTHSTSHYWPSHGNLLESATFNDVAPSPSQEAQSMTAKPACSIRLLGFDSWLRPG